MNPEEYIYEDESIRIMRDTVEPWRVYVLVWKNSKWEIVDNPRLGDMAKMALAILTEYHEKTQWG